jgi:hypothetical protein
VKLEELVLAVEQHCQQMTPVIDRLTSGPDDTLGSLVGLLKDTDDSLARLCVELRAHARAIERAAEGQEPGT